MSLNSVWAKAVQKIEEKTQILGFGAMFAMGHEVPLILRPSQSASSGLIFKHVQPIFEQMIFYFFACVLGVLYA